MVSHLLNTVRTWADAPSSSLACVEDPHGVAKLFTFMVVGEGGRHLLTCTDFNESLFQWVATAVSECVTQSCYT